MQKNDPVTMIVFFAVMLLIMILGFRSAAKHSRNKKEQEEAREKAHLDSLHEYQRQQNEIMQAKLEKEQKELDRKLAMDDMETSFGLYADYSFDHTQKDQQIRIGRAYDQKDQIKVLGYDPRYKIAKIQGTSFKKYLTSMNVCTCQDFADRRKPCKHMYRLVAWLEEHGEDSFEELDYETGLDHLAIFLDGSFPEGTEKAVKDLKERGANVTENQRDFTKICAVGKTRAVKKYEEMQRRGIAVLKYSEALKLFTSEVRHEEYEEAGL